MTTEHEALVAEVRSLAAAVQELADRRAVADVVLSYATAVDRRDWEAVRACFEEGAVVEGTVHQAPLEPYLRSLVDGVEHFGSTMHFMGNQLVSVDGDLAEVETYAVAFHWMGEQPGADDDGNLVVGVRYLDTLARSADGWRIRRRRVTSEWRRGAYPPS